jgi:glycosyltransferase involved in cell wall biosynthesis
MNSDKMKILQLCIRFPPAPGGAENHVYHISRELKDRGHDVSVFTTDLYTEVPFVRINQSNPVYDGIPVTRFKAYSLKGEMHYVLIPKMIRAILKEQPDIIHAHSYGYYQSTAGAFANMLKERPMIITPHFHPSWSMWGGKKRKGLRKVYDKVIAKSAMRTPDIVICHTKNEKELLKQYSIPEERIKIIPAGIDFSQFKTIPSGNIFRKKYDILGKMILYTGRLASNKGLLYLIESAPNILSEFVDATFVFVGEDEGQREILEEKAKELGISDNVLFTGHITDYDLFLSSYSACDVFVLPSEYEAFGLVLLEAGACEKPCVATRVGGVPEVIEGGKTGMLVDYGDSRGLSEAILELLKDDNKRKEMGEAARKRVKNKFTWPKVVDELEKVYENVLLQ